MTPGVLFVGHWGGEEPFCAGWRGWRRAGGARRGVLAAAAAAAVRGSLVDMCPPLALPPRSPDRLAIAALRRTGEERLRGGRDRQRRRSCEGFPR